MKKIKVMAIVPYRGLKDIIVKLRDQYEQLELEVMEGDLYEGVNIAQKAERRGFHVILSRGGTSSLIQQFVTIPVVEIQVTGYDLVRSVTLVKGYEQEVAVVGFENITNGTSSIAELLELNISIHTMKNEKEIYQELQKVQKKGTKKVILGDVVTVKYAKEIGLNGVLITSGEESIKDSLDIIINLFKYYKSNYIEKALMKEALNIESKIIVMVNKNGEVVLANQNSYDGLKLGIKIENTWKDLWLLLQDLFKNKENVKSYILEWKNLLWSIQAYYKKIDDEGFAILYLKNTNWFDNFKGINVTRTKLENVNTNPFNKIVGKSTRIQKVVEQSKEYSLQDDPILIIGGQGTGKSTFSYMIHQYSNRNKGPFITVDCSILSIQNEDLEMKFYELVKTGKSGTIYLKNIDELTRFSQTIILELIRVNEINRENCRFIASTTTDIFENLEKGTFNKEILNKLSKFSVRIPSLNERVEDINSLAKLFIASFNLKYGKQIAGLKEDVIKGLELVDWERAGNISALEKILEELILLSNGPFIESQDAEEVLKKLEINNYDKQIASILNGSLEEIERKIIQVIMKEEKNNQTAVAERLNINRTTLWRKLKEK